MKSFHFQNLRSCLVVLLASFFLAACDKEPAPAATTTAAPPAETVPAEAPAPAAETPMPAEAPADAPTETTPAPDAASLPASIVIGLDDHFPPMGFRDDKNEIVGFDIDLAREAGKRLGIEVIFKPIDWSAKEAELTGKRIDMLWNGLTITEERKANILFTQPYVQNSQIIMVTESSPIKLKADLAGKIVGAQDGSSAIDAIERDAETAQSFGELKKFSDNVTALMDLSAGRLDAVVVDEIVGRYYAAKKVGEYRILDENFGTEEYGVGLRKEDTELAARIDKVLDDIKADGTGTSISTQWFGADILKR